MPDNPTHIDRDVDQLLGRQQDLIAGRPPVENNGPFGDNPPLIKNGWQYYWNGFSYVPVPGGKVSDDGSGSGSSWSGTYVNDALAAASQAIQSFLTGQSLADARKLSAAEQFQSMAAWALPAGSLPGGFEEGGPMQQLAALQGRPTYTAPSRETRRVNPSALIEAGQVPDEVMQFIDQILGAADQGRVVTTGGSSSRSG